MPRGSTIAVENNFVKGLLTEPTAMNFPEDAASDADNVIFSEKGEVTRRLGIDIESSGVVHELSDFSDSPDVFVEFKWDSVGGVGTTSFLVQQVGEKVKFFKVGEESISQELAPFEVNLLDYKTTTDETLISSKPCQFTFGKGFLFIAHPFVEPLSVEYLSDENDILIKTIVVEIRDFERLDDGLAIDERPTVLTNLHHYNLYNQGWDTIQPTNSGTRQVLAYWKSKRSDNPSNADVFWLFRDRDGSDVGQINVAWIDRNGYRGSTPAPNGYYIYPAWNINRSAKSGIANLPSLSSKSSRPSCIAFYAGRIFYSGISADKFADKVYFSQIIESEDQFGKCHQFNDPTSEAAFDLLDSDGGVISLPLISKIISLKAIGDALIVIGTNGVFVIRGTTNGPFKATDYTVEFISDVGGISDLSIVKIDNSLVWWNYDAIYGLSMDQVGASYQVENISKPTIQSIVDSIPPDNKMRIKGIYNKKDRVVQWLFDDRDDVSLGYNRILEFNVVSKAFYTYTISTSLSPQIVGIISISGQKSEAVEEEVVTLSGEIVTTVTGQEVVISRQRVIPNTESFKYPTLIYEDTLGFTYSDSSEYYEDWTSFGGASFDSFFVSGYRIRGELLRSFNSTPISVVLRKIDDGAIWIKGVWDYGSRITTPQSLYLQRSDIGDYLIRRVKLRGKGKSFQLRFDSEGNSPFSLIGWSTFDSGGQVP